MADEVTDSSNRFESGNAPPEFPESPKLHYRQLYFNSLDIVIACIKARFDQPGYSIYSKMESVLLKAANNQEFLEELNTVSKFYNNDIDCRLLKIQLQTLSTHFQNTSTPVNCDPHRPKNDFKDLKNFLINLTSAQRQLFSEFLFKMMLLAPATNAVSERSCSALRRTKTWLRTTMSQERLNHCLMLHVHKSLTDELNLMSIAEEFVSVNESRLRTFGHFSS